MANKRISALTEELTPATSDVVPIDGATTRKTTIVNLVGAARPFASQAEAEAGSGTTQTMNPLASKQLVDYERTQARSFSGIQTFTTASAGTAPVRLESSDAGASQGPFIDLARTSTSPAAADALGSVRFRGMDSAATETLYGSVRARIIDPTDASEDGAIEFLTIVAGAQTQGIGLANGVVLGAATGSYQGTGTLNATGYYLNGSALASTLFGVTPGTIGLALLDDVLASDARTTLGLGSAAVLTAGDASGNLKALNADGAFTFATTATSANVAGVNSGTWKTAHRFDSTDTATLSGNRTTMAILRGYTGSGENGPTRSDTALHLEDEQDNWLTTSVLGEGDTLRVFNRKGVNGDGSGILINVSKVESASYGSLAWEAASNWVQATTGTTLRLMRTNSGHQGPATDLRGGGTGFNATAVTGDHKIAFAAFQDSTDTGKWTYPFLGADGYSNGDEYFYVTGPAHANGKGQLYTSALATIAGGVAAPAGGSTAAVLRMGSFSTFGIYFGTGAPTVSAAKGSLYLRRDGTTTNNRAYINTDGATTWTGITTAA